MARAANRAVLAMGVLVLAGCRSSDSPIFFSSPTPPYPDVPVPVTFELMSTNSPNPGATVGARYMEHVYQSKDALEPVAQYFRDQLPKNGWTLQGQTQGNGDSMMRFSKGGELLEIQMWRGSTIRTNTRLRITGAAGMGK